MANPFGQVLNFFTSSWDQSGVGGGQSRVVRRLATSGSVNTSGNVHLSSGQKAGDLISDNLGCFGANANIKQLLRDWYLTNTFLNFFTSPLIDIFNKSSFECKIENLDDSVVDDVNKYLDELDVFSFIKDNLKEALYWGSYISPIEFSQQTGKSKLGQITHSTEFVPITVLNLPGIDKAQNYYGYKTDNFAEFSTNPLDDASGVVLLPAKDAVYMGFNMTKSIKIVLNEEKKVGVEKLKANVIYKQPRGVLDDCLNLLYNHLLNSYIYQLLTLKNALRPDVLMARMQNPNISNTQSTDDIENIEACLNNNEGGIAMGLFGDPSSILSAITSSILNQVKVVPSLMNYTDFELIEFPALEEKLAKLLDGLQTTKLQIANQLGIPQELLDSNGGSRWEVLSRSTTYKQAILSQMADITIFLKSIVTEYLASRHGLEVNSADIIFNFNTSNILFNSEEIQKQQLINETLQFLSQAISNRDNIAESPGINRQALDDFVMDQLGQIGPAYKKVLQMPLPTIIGPNGMPLPPQVVQQMMATGQIDQFGNPVMPPNGAENEDSGEES